MAQCVALLRGINVGKAKRIAMADLKRWVEGLGHGEVRTLLNSGNVVFEASRPNVGALATAIESAIKQHSGFEVPTTVISASTLRAIVDDNPLLKHVKDPARHLIAFANDAKTLRMLKAMEQEPWKPDLLWVSPKAAYLWCVEGVLDSPLSKAFSRRAGHAVTARNWATVLKLRELTGP